MNYFKNLYKGRISQGRFFFGSLFIGIFYAVVYFIVTLIPTTNESTTLTYISSSLFTVAVFLFVVLSTIYSFSTLVRRLHDLDQNGLVSLLSLIPFVNIIFWFCLWLMSGSEGVNKYGSKPTKTTSFFKDIFNPN